jgi:hypothetical protein
LHVLPVRDCEALPEREGVAVLETLAVLQRLPVRDSVTELLVEPVRQALPERDSEVVMVGEMLPLVLLDQPLH